MHLRIEIFTLLDRVGWSCHVIEGPNFDGPVYRLVAGDVSLPRYLDSPTDVLEQVTRSIAAQLARVVAPGAPGGPG